MSLFQLDGAGRPPSGAPPIHARIRALGERTVATLKSWKVLTIPRRPRRAIVIAQAILVPRLIDEDRYSG